MIAIDCIATKILSVSALFFDHRAQALNFCAIDSQHKAELYPDYASVNVLIIAPRCQHSLTMEIAAPDRHSRERGLRDCLAAGLV